MRLLLLALAAAVAPAAGLNLQMPALRGQTGLTDARFGGKKLVVVTGTSSGLGRKTAAALLRTGKYHVVGAVRDLDKMEVVAEVDGFDPDLFTPMHCELNSFASVRAFVDELKEWKAAKPVDRLICNAAVYQPSLPYAKWSEDGHEQQMQINYLSHFLLTRPARGGGVYPIADLKKLDGLKLGAKNPISMFDGYNFDGAKAQWPWHTLRAHLVQLRGGDPAPSPTPCLGLAGMAEADETVGGGTAGAAGQAASGGAEAALGTNAAVSQPASTPARTRRGFRFWRRTGAPAEAEEAEEAPLAAARPEGTAAAAVEARLKQALAGDGLPLEAPAASRGTPAN
ncbi:putative protochlorophyllide reductase [Emiliania huxleyi CCMP1516]|uniref:protochlorophyllide reductase n=2 Tax=Emiliania huxleyi TaxID=2903 RepID=A0A0D3K192_EMIH1|nr:putative protochlorophyllide reductase [Emiliania huxleyi CCMP1516]EOD29527.1 putative protochlorophyllide reductase [Emiliania huxleyi CCMP1516]|eukprot:XP_005781956.1 putative protochlorophyllide reductase [Emiliania huxleyi CCMP1516]